MAQVAISVAMAMPLIGFDELPIRPQIREDTVTNKKPKTTTKIDASRFAPTEVSAPGIGRKVSRPHIMTMMASEPKTTKLIGRSRSRRVAAGAVPARPARTSLIPAIR